MARVRVTDSGDYTGSLTWKVDGLDYPANHSFYSDFRLEYGESSSSSRSNVYWSGGSSTATERRVSGLYSNTQYVGTMYVQFKGGSWSSLGTAYGRTKGQTVSAPTVSRLDVSGGDRSIYYNFSTSGIVDEQEAELYQGSTYIGSKYNESGTFTGLADNTRYTVKVTVGNSGGSNTSSASDYTNAAEFPKSVIGSVSFSGQTATSFNYSISANNSPTAYEFQVLPPKGSESVARGTAQSGTISGLTQIGEYSMIVRAYNQAGWGPYKYFFVSTTKTKIFFSWGSGVSSGSPFNITAGKWNDLTKAINTKRQNEGYGIVSFTTAYRNETFTANMYNQALDAISSLGGSGKPTIRASRGSICYASELVKFQDYVNS